MEADFINLSGYRFFNLPQIHDLRAQLKSLCEELKLYGTLLLSPEGINIGLSGARDPIDAFKHFVTSKLGFQESDFKETRVKSISFNRLLVKIKKEIITVGDPSIRPTEQTGIRLSPQDLKTWLDEKRPIVLLDARNQYETEIGAFTGAETLQLETSREFTEKVTLIAKKLKNQTVVTYCTGGIRCEKASAVLLKLGVADVYQLDGGILRYFEEQGPAHFEGNCFVFDWRLAVNGKLEAVDRSPDPEARFGCHQQKIR